MFTGLQRIALELPRSVKAAAQDASLVLRAFPIGSQSEGLRLHWLARRLDSGCTPFLVACTNASLLDIPIYGGLSLLLGKSRALSLQTVLYHQLWTLRETYPRGPPSRARQGRS